MVYDAPDCFFERFHTDMATLGRVYISIHNGKNTEDGYDGEISYSTEERPNTWELRYLKSQPLKILVWSDEECDFVLSKKPSPHQFSEKKADASETSVQHLTFGPLNPPCPRSRDSPNMHLQMFLWRTCWNILLEN